MAESSPGNDDDYEGSAEITDSSPNSQPSSLHINDGSFEKTTITSHPLAEIFRCVNGLEFRIRGLQEKCPSFTYASLPGVSPAQLDWKVCCEPDQDVGGEYVTYHKLTDSDDSLSAVMANYAEPNIVGLIIINTFNSITLSSGFINKADIPTTPPVYILSLEDGDKLRAFFNTHDEGAVQIKVYVESPVDSASTGLYLPLSKKTDSQSKLDLHSPYNLHEELKKILFVDKKERIHACANRTEFQFLISCVHNYEVQIRRESQDKAIKMLGNFTEETFKKDFLFYLLLAHRFLVYHVMYGDSNAINNYVKLCIEKLEAMNDVQAMANVILTFFECGDFTVQFNHGLKSDASVFQLLYHMASIMLKKSNKLQTKNHKINIYCRILWIALVIYFGLEVNVSESLLTPLWGTDLLSDQVQGELAFSDDIVKEFTRGFELLRALGLPESVYFLPSELAIFLNPLKIKALHISHITQLLSAGQCYLKWNLISLCHILPPLRSNYDGFLNRIEIGWTRYSKDGTKIGVYKEFLYMTVAIDTVDGRDLSNKVHHELVPKKTKALKFLESIYDWIPQSTTNVKDDQWADVAKSHLEKWIGMLVDHIDMCAHDAMDFVKLIRSHSGLKKYSKFISGKIQTKGMQIVAELTMLQFSTLFIGSLFWKSEFVEAFLNYYTVPNKIELKNSSWKLLLEEIISRFSDANCKKCIVGLIGRISKAYKSAGKQDTFVLDLVKMDIPNLLLVMSNKGSSTNVEKFFIDMVSAFIQKNALREVILGQIPTIMKLVKPGNHLQTLIVTVIQKEAVPDSKMLEKLHLTNPLKLVITESVTAASNSLTGLSHLSEADKFYWHFIASCCNHVQPNRENLAKVNTYLFAIEKLSTIFHEYCTKNNIEKSVINIVPQEISHILNADVKSYFSWIVKMQEIMIHWQIKFMDQDFNFDDIFTYAGKLQSINAFAKAVCTEHLVYTADEITQLKDGYSAIYTKLCSLLVKNDKEYGWCTLVEIFSCYGIKFSHTLQAKLDTHLVLPEGGPVVITDDMQQILNQPNGQLELKPEMILRLKKSVTWKILQEIFDDLELFLEPIKSHLEFLVYFHLHNCEMFSKHLKSKMAKLSANSEEPVKVSDIKLTFSTICITQSSTNHDEKLLQFAIALQSTKDFILSLIKGTAKYAEIFAEGLLQEDLIQKFDTESEFRIMCAFPEFQDISAANEEGKEGIKHMLELFQYSEQISVIPEVCRQYHLDQCSQDPKLNELMNIVNTVKTAEDRDKVTGKTANDHMKKIWEVLKFDDTSIAKKCLKIFPAVANCAEFYQFIQNKRFVSDTNAFRSQVELITAQLQHEDYNETVLNHLMPAFQYICPFLDKEQSLGDLMNKIIKLYHDGIGFGCDSRRDFCQLETVNSNIIMIQLWFSRTEGDTLENISAELDCIMNSGHFKLIIKPKRITSTSKIDSETVNEHKSEVFLNYVPTMESYLQRRRLRRLSESHDEDASSSFHVERQYSSVSETWINEQIDDFVRKLGFLEAQSTEVEQKVKLFQQLSQTAQKFYYTLLKLRDLGHPDYMETTEKIICSDKLESAESKVTKAEEKLKTWSATIRNMHSSYDKLLFFSFSKVLSLYDILTAPVFSVDEMVQDVGFLFENDPKAIKKLQRAVKDCASNLENVLSPSNETPVSYVGKYLEKLCSTVSLVEHFLNGRSQPSISVKKNSLLAEIIHFAPHCDNGQLLHLLIKIYNGVPESYEVFQCDENSIEEDLKLFLSRASKFRHHTFTILGVNKLPYRLQEVILQYHSQETEQTVKSAIRLNYIETASSILHEMPWVEVKEYKENDPDLKWNDAKLICGKCVNKGNVNYDLRLVYGNAGDGKTHYIKRQLHKDQPSLVITVNESFSPLNAILKLRKLPRNKTCNIFFNFTIVPSIMSTTPEEQMKYGKLMNTLAWFFFRLLVFEYIEDSETGMAFRLPGGQQWKIFIEVPSLSELNQENVEQHLEWIYNKIPIFRLLGKSVLIEKGSPYAIDSSVQLVCKYLQAYKNRADTHRGINRLYVDKGPLVKFGDNPDLTDEQCYSLLKDYMPPHVTRNKVLQQLFIKYMERRCIFMENFPAFYCNSGCGLKFDHKQVNKNKLEEMVKNKMLVKLQERYYSNTSQLGQVLMETMLKEVSEFCKINIQQSWATQTHQQLIYEVKGGAGTIQLLTLKPEELSEEITKKFEALGIEIPNIKQLGDRKKLDSYLSSALGVPLQDGRLQDIDEAEYVLTLDYTVKMLNIHERRECGIPVIIEGETGVGKTALINMLSKLWNHALISEWRVVKRRIIEMLHQINGTDNSDLQNILKKLNTDLELNKELKATDTFEEGLIQLAEMQHTLPEGNIIPFYQFINKRLQEMANSEIILGLLDVNFETKDDQHHDNFNKVSAIPHWINNVMSASSAQATAKLLCTLLNGNLIPTFYKLNIHAALSPKKVQEFFIPVVKLAKHLLKIHEEKQLKGMNKPPVVIVFLDEVNTSSCMGLFKEIIIDKTFEGELLPPNIFLVAACNPHRGNSLTLLENKDEYKAETWFRGSYYVQKLHPTMRFLMWDYGSLNHEQEAAYVQSKMIMVNEDFNIVQNVVFSELVVKCQNLIRRFAYEQLKNFGIENNEARLRANSCVSQRDIQRVFIFYGWISKAYEMLQVPSTEGVTTATMALGDMPAASISEHPMISDNLNREEMKQRALLVALGLVYYMRLDSEYREKFAKELDKMHFVVEFLTAFTQEMDFYTNELSLPPGIAKTEALKENLFATIICTVTKTPLIIVGAPGSSKTLSFNLTISNLKGPESKQKLFRNTEVFKSLDPHCYQCSRRTTSTEIETVFQRAINRQRSHRSCFSKAIHCVVFMDEAGLPEESHESLKVLHFHLDQQEVAFVAITNHILDAAKTNRAVSLFRPTASQRDLETLAKGCLCTNPESPPPELKEDLATIVKFCPAYYAIMKEDRFKNFFGLRDFIHFIHYIRRERKVEITPQLVLQSLERNFNGTKGFEHICSVFLEKVKDKLIGKLQQRTIVEILQSSLDDKPFVYQPVNKRISSLSLADTQNEVRYKLIIDPSEDESITRLLFMFGILKRENTRTYMCSDFPGDGQLQKINTIAAIRHSAIAGHTVIMSQTDDIHESFYDLFNQHFRRIDDPKDGPRYFTNIAIGAHLKPSRVDQNFQCIVVIKESEVKNTPAPFLNRFEKYLLSHNSLLNLVLNALPPCLKVVVNVIHDKVKEFSSLLGQSSFYGGNEETVCSLLLKILPRPGHKYKLVTQSLVSVDSEVNDTSSSFTTEGFSNKKALLLKNVVKSLHEFGGFCYMESTVEELEHDANYIVSILATTGSEFAGIAEKLESCDVNAISEWIADALYLLYTEDGPPDDTCDDHDSFVKTLGASNGACMVTAVIAQWLVRYICKKLMQLMTPEAAILNRKFIPISYLETYLNYQTHFSLKELIEKQSELLNQCGEDKIATKLICYTRSTPSIHHLPAVFPRTTFCSAEDLQKSNNVVEDLICDKANNVFLCKLSSISSQTAFKLQLQAFKASQQQTIFVLIISMQDTSRLIINHIRIMIEEAELTKTEIKKLYVLLLHFPAMMFYDPCYPSLFLYGWDHYYLDAIDQTNESVLVDTREWFRYSCLSSKEASLPTAINESMYQSLLALLNKPESILVIASRILLNIDSNVVSLDSLPDIDAKDKYLKKLLFDKKVADVLCYKFKSYWRPSVMGSHLEQAARFSKSRESTLNVSDSVDSIYRSSFFNFMAYMIYQMSKSHNLDMLFSDACDNAALDLFLKLLDAYPIPKLSEVKAYNNTWDCRVHTAGRSAYIPQFPFFMEVSSHICSMVEQSIAEINKLDDILQENSDVVDSRGKEQILTKLYKNLCDKTSAIIETKEKVGEKYMSAIAIMEMENDEQIWQKYFNDFTHYYLHLSGASPDDLEHKLVKLTFTDVLNNYSKMKSIAIHCHVHLNQLDLAKVVASLKPLGQLEEFKSDEDSLYPEDPEYSLVGTFHTSKSALGSSSISKFVIGSLFAALVNAIYSKDKDNRLCSIQKWFNSYRDMMSVASLKKILTVTLLTKQLKTQYHLMEAASLVLLSFNDITDAAAECVCILACHLCTKCFNQNFQLICDKPLDLNQIVSSFHKMLESPQFNKLASIPQLYQYVMEGLFTHFFPDTNNSTTVYSKEDIKFFLTFANEQNKWKSCIEAIYQFENLINISKFKFYLDRILCKGWSKSGTIAKPLTFYKLEIRICVGETILSHCPKATLNEYTPSYLLQATTDNQSNPLMQQTLMHIYFYTVLEKLQTCQFTPTRLVKMITDTEMIMHSEAATNAEQLIAAVERQALLEALLQAIVDNFDLDDKSKMDNFDLDDRSKITNMLRISDQLNNLIKDQSHRDILLMHLMKKHHGPQGVLNLLADKHKKCWEPFNCLKLIKEKLKGSCPPTSHQFPFVVGNTIAEHQFNIMYKDLCKHLHKVAKGSSTKETETFLNSIINSSDNSYDGKSTIRMMIWLYVYYEFYCKKKQSTVLIEFFKKMKKKLGLSEERLYVLNCFLDPENMIKMEEVPNPLNPNAEVLEYTEDGKIRPKQPPSNVPKTDPIWEFFNPTDAHEDPSDVDLRHALANMIAVVFGLPDHSTHLWYHMFSPRDLENSYLTGFMYNKIVKKGTLMYDCGCELNEDGHYGRSDYNSRDSFSLHSWYLLLWCNFGAFCIGLLTQPTALMQLRGHILSDWMSIRDYCMTQLRTVWFHMRTNMSFGDEERSFFIMTSMYQLFMLFQEKKAFPYFHGKFIELDSLIDYEKAWHKLVYESSKADLKNKLENHSSHSVWTLPVVKNLRTLEQHYPHPATENDYMISLVNATEDNKCSYTHLFALNLFTLEQKKLQVGGTLLPDLMEFYKWIHTQLSHLMTHERAKQITIGQVINLTTKRYSQEICDHLTSLFKRINSKYNDYLKVNGGVIGSVTCNRVTKPTDVHYITKDTPLINLVSFEDTNKNDWLYIVLMDIIENHNGFLSSIYTHTTSPDCHYKKYLPDNPPEVHPTEVTGQTCIVPSVESDGKQFLKLINSHYIYNGSQSTAVFDLEQLEQDVVKFYVAGKPLIAIDSSIRTVFRFRNSPTENTLPRNNPGCATDISAIAQELPDDYKISLQEETKMVFEFHFRTASYHTFTEIVNGLRTVMGHLIQDILQRKERKDKEFNTKLLDYLRKFFKKEHQVFNEIGILSINDKQRKLLGDVEMKMLFKCLGLFVGWLQGGLYDFSSLPISVFKHLKCKDVNIIMETCSKYSSTEMEHLLIELDEFEKSLNHAENHLITKEELKSSIIQCLIDLGFCESTDEFVSLIPKSILVCHYVHFRTTLRKLKIKVKDMACPQVKDPSAGENKWTEIIEDLWKVHLPHFQDEVKVFDDNCLKFDCVTYGDGEESDSDSETWLDHNIPDMEDSVVEVSETKETEKKEIIQKIKDDPKLKEEIMKTLVHDPAPSSVSPSVTASSTPSLLTATPSGKAMTTEELCQWLKEKRIDDKYIEYFRKDDIDGSVLAEYTDEDLKGMGISEPHIRKKIRIQFRKIK